MRLTAFAAPAMMMKTSTYQPQPSGIHLSTIGTKTVRGSSFWWSAATQTTAEVASRSSILIRPESPSERRWRTLIRSSSEADRAAGEHRPEDRQRGQRADGRREERDRRGDHDQDAAHGRRPLLRPSGARAPPRGSCWPSEWRRRKSMKNGPASIEMISATSAATRTCAMVRRVVSPRPLRVPPIGSP